jgi:hypothetical protein
MVMDLCQAFLLPARTKITQHGNGTSLYLVIQPFFNYMSGVVPARKKAATLYFRLISEYPGKRYTFDLSLV